MSLEIKNTKTTNEKFINTIVYGDSGVGKTSLIRTLPVEATLVLSAENGLLSVADCGVDYVETKSISDIMTILKTLDVKKYRHVVIDSITELGQNHFVFLKKKYPDAKNALQLWGDFGGDFQEMFKKLRDMKISVLAVALLKEKENATGQMEKMPDIYGKTAKKIQAWFDEVFYMHIDKDGNRMFLTEKTTLTDAKDRSTKLDKIEKADMRHIHGKIFN